MRVEFLRDWKWFKRGQVADLTKGRGDLLCKRRLCKPAPLPEVKAEPVRLDDDKPKKRRKHAIPKPPAAD